MKKTLLSLLLGGAFLSILFFFNIREKNESFSSRKTEKIIYKHFFDSPVRSVDPLDTADIYTQRIVLSIYDTLYEYCFLTRPYLLKPSLAESLPKMSEDALVYTIRLKEGIYFPDAPCFEEGKGREVLAEDFIYSMKRHFDKDALSSSSWIWRGKIEGLDDWEGFSAGGEISGLRALDKRTVQIRLTEPFPQFLHTLAQAFTAVVPKEAVEFYGKDFPRNPVGSGAWKLGSLNSKKIVLKKNESYRDEWVEDLELEGAPSTVASSFQVLKGKKLPLCDEIHIHCFTSADEAWWSFEGEPDLDYVRLPKRLKASFQIESLKEEFIENYEDKYSVYKETAAEVKFFGFNMAHPNFGRREDPELDEKNKALRKALRYAFQWKTLLARTYLGRGKVFPGVAPSILGKHFSSLSEDSITYNPGKAKALLKKHGWNKENLPELVFTGVGSLAAQQEFELFRSFYTKIGYPKEKIKSAFYVSFPEMFGALRESTHPSFGYITWYVDIPDAFDVLQLFYSPNKAPGMNFMNYENKEFDHLYEQISRLQDSTERSDLIKRAVEIIIEDCPLISGFSPYTIHMWRKDFLVFPSKQTNFFKYIARKDSL